MGGPSIAELPRQCYARRSLDLAASMSIAASCPSVMNCSRCRLAWLAACTAALISIALIVFMVQNTATVPVYFLWMTGNTSLGLMLLIAALGGIVVTLILGSARIIQLRHVVRRNAKRSRDAAHTS